VIERLVTALQALATGGSTRDMQDTVGSLADTLFLVRQCQALELTASQKSALDRLDRALGFLDNGGDPQMQSAGWEDLRRLARAALAALQTTA
jgi:hypothetical protein